MSNSLKKTPITKNGRIFKKLWWRIIRSNWKQELRTKGIDADFKDEYEILNQYKHCDRISICINNCWCVRHFGRKKCLDK